MRISHDFGWFFANRIQIRVIDMDLDWEGQNDADPTAYGYTSLVNGHIIKDLFVGYFYYVSTN